MGTDITSVSLFSVVMYYVSEQKIVAIFKSGNIASKYVFGKPGYVTGHSVAKRSVNKSNPYDKAITFRVAGKEHTEQLGKDDFLILDKRFSLKDSERRMGVKILSGTEQPIFKGLRSTEIDIERLAKLAGAGYTTDEIAAQMNMRKSSIAYFITKHKIPVLLGFGINNSVEELKSYISLLQVRLNRLGNTQIS